MLELWIRSSTLVSQEEESTWVNPHIRKTVTIPHNPRGTALQRTWCRRTTPQKDSIRLVHCRLERHGIRQLRSVYDVSFAQFLSNPWEDSGIDVPYLSALAKLGTGLFSKLPEKQCSPLGRSSGCAPRRNKGATTGGIC